MDENNKYSVILNSSPDSEDRKLARKKKRKQSRIVAFIVMGLFMAAIIVGIFFGVRIIISRVRALQAVSVSEETPVSIPSEVEEILNEVSITEPIPDTPEVVEPEGPTEEDLYNEWLEAQISELPLEDKVMGLFIVSPEQITGVSTVIKAGDGTKNALENYHVGGLIYKEDNILSADQFKGMLEKTASFVKYETFFILNEESGNTVLANKLKLESTMGAEEIGSSLDPNNSYSENSKIAGYLKEYGINFNVGIVGDVLFRETDGETEPLFMAERAYGTDINLVSKMVEEAVKAYEENDVFVAMGCFPGQGSLICDPREQVTNTTITVEQVTGNQSQIYENAVSKGLDAIVISHEYAENLTSGNLPCSLSKEIYTDLLRGSMGLEDTILITDALNKPAVSEYYTSEEACVKALKAGADMVMCPENFEEGYNAVLDAVKSGVISEERINDSLRRVWRVKYRRIYESSINGENENSEVSGND